MSSAVVIRPAERSDVALVLSMITELADYERAADQVTGTTEQLDAALFGSSPAAEAVIAELDGAPAGVALFYRSFSTWLCASGLYLEDLYVRPAYRGHGVGRALLGHLAALVVERGYARLEWSVLDWNVSAIEFYERLGATHLDEWKVFRLAGRDLVRVAKQSDDGS